MDQLGEGHIIRRYDGELKHLNYLTLEMGALVFGQLNDALDSFKRRDTELARKVVNRDSEVDRLEVVADDEILKLLACRSPVSGDLRLVFTVAKSVSDLERIGDEAVRIAGLVIQLFGHEGSDPHSQMLRDVNRMGDMVLAGLREAVSLFEQWNDETATRVIEHCRELDEEFQADLRRLITYILEDARNIGFAISVVLVIKALERIGHHSQNLAEYAIYQAHGEDLRNRQP